MRKYSKAKDLIQKIANINKKELNNKYTFNEEREKEIAIENEKLMKNKNEIKNNSLHKNYFDLFTYKSLRMLTIGACFMSFSIKYILNGSILAISTLDGNPYMNTFYIALAEFIGRITSGL